MLLAKHSPPQTSAAAALDACSSQCRLQERVQHLAPTSAPEPAGAEGSSAPQQAVGNKKSLNNCAKHAKDSLSPGRLAINSDAVVAEHMEMSLLL